MNLNDEANSYSDLLKQAYQSSTEKSNEPNKFIVYAISNYKCCNNRIIITTNDGNKTQICKTCNYKHR